VFNGFRVPVLLSQEGKQKRHAKVSVKIRNALTEKPFSVGYSFFQENGKPTQQ
jgi:hypothetical protein